MEKQADLTQLLQSRPQDCPCIFRYLHCLYPRAIRSIIALGSSLGSSPSTNPLAPDLLSNLGEATGNMQTGVVLPERGKPADQP